MGEKNIILHVQKHMKDQHNEGDEKHLLKSNELHI